MAENNGGAQHRQALLEPHQLFSEAPWARHLRTQPGGGRVTEERRGISINRNGQDGGMVGTGEPESRLRNRGEDRNRN